MPPVDPRSDSDDSDVDYVPEDGNADSGSDEDFIPDKDDDAEFPGGDFEAGSTGKSRGRKLSHEAKSSSKRLKSDSRLGASSKPEWKDDISNVKKAKDEKAITDALWEDFLKDATSSASGAPKVEVDSSSRVGSSSFEKSEVKPDSNASTHESESRLSVGIDVPLKEETARPVVTPAVTIPPPRASGSLLGRGGIPSVRGAGRGLIAGGGLGRLMGGEKKLSVLEQSKRDWRSFKRDEGLEDDLKQHAQSRHSFVEKQQFLTRVDLREFEKEKAVRDVNRRRQQ